MNKILCSGLALLFFTACGSAEADRQEQMTKELSAFKGAGPIAYMTFSGTYSSDCVVMNVAGGSVYQKETLHFDSGIDRASTSAYQTNGYSGPSEYSYTEHSTLYQDSDCSTAIADESAQGKHNFAANGIQLVLTAKKLQMTPKSSRGAEAFNQAQLCGDSNWKSNEEKELSERACFSQYSTQYTYLNLVDEKAKNIELYFCKTGNDLPSECIKVPMQKR